MAHEPGALKQIMQKENLNWRSFSDDGTIAEKWNGPATPAFYVVDHKGVIQRKWIGHPGEETIDRALEKLIGEVKE